MMTHKGTQSIYTDRLLLRQIKPDDAADVFTWMSDSEVCKYERWSPHESVEYSRGYIKAVFDYTKSNTYQWGIELNGKLIGFVCVVNVDDYDEKAVMGYVVARAYWSQGYITEAARAVIKYMFMEIGINRIEATHSINNPASGRVLIKLGFVKEGHAKEYYRCAVGFQDSDIYALTKSDYVLDSEGIRDK